MKVLPPLLIAVLIAVINIMFPVNLTAFADAETLYAYAAESNTAYICGKASLSSALFAVPKSYCVKILSEEDGWYYVSYAEDTGIYRTVYGYCKVEYLTIISEPPLNTYLYMPVTVTFSAATETLPSLENIEVTAAYYGNYNMGSVYYSYVLYNGSFGYIEGSVDEYPQNEYTVETFDEVENNSVDNSALIVILAVAAISAVAVVMLYVTGKKPKA